MVKCVALWRRCVNSSAFRRIIQKLLVVSLCLADLHLLFSDVIPKLLDPWFLNTSSIAGGQLIAAKLNVKFVDFPFKLPILCLLFILVRLQFINFLLELNLLLNKLFNLILHLLLVACSKVKVIN
jgi:hypothetical protein